MATLAPGPSAPPPPDRPAPADSRPGVRTCVAGLVRAARPRQWLKNLLVVPAPAAAGVLGRPDALLATAVAFGAFCLAASGAYLINDARDVRLDRAHPRKRHRPVARGVVPVGLAYAAGGVALATGLGLAGLTGNPPLLAAVAGYVALTGAYSLGLKRVPLVDLVTVAAGFVLRAVAGGAAVQVQISGWFLIVTSLASLFVVVGKREAELGRTVRDGAPAADTRPALAGYSARFLGQARCTAAGALLVAYSVWALESHEGPTTVALGLSVLPFAGGVLRYGALLNAGHGEAPEDLVLSDRLLLGAGMLVAAGVGVGIYAV